MQDTGKTSKEKPDNQWFTRLLWAFFRQTVGCRIRNGSSSPAGSFYKMEQHHKAQKPHNTFARRLDRNHSLVLHD